MRLSHGLMWIAIVAGCGTQAAADTTAETTTAEGSSTPESTSPSTTASTSSPTTTVSSTATGSETSASSTAPAESGTGTDGSGSSSTTTTETSSTSTTSGSDDGCGSSDTGAMHQGCTDGCAIEFMCGDEWLSAEECIDWCEANLVEAECFSPFCADAWENLSICFGTLDCEQYAVYLMPEMFPYPCSDEADALAFECKGQ